MPHIPGVYPWPFDGDLRARNTALVLIDMQVDFCGPGGMCDRLGDDMASLRGPIAPLQALLAAARRAGLAIVHTREGHRPDLSDLPANKRWRSRRCGVGIGDPSPFGRALTRGEPGWEIVPELAPEPGEVVIDKPGKGAFYATDLDQILRARGIRNLLVTGLTTDCCVQSTMRDANDRGYECLLVEDCCACANPAHHAPQIEMFKLNGGHYGSVARSPETIAALDALAAAATEAA